MTTPTPEQPRKLGEVEEAVSSDLKKVENMQGIVAGSFRTMALRLARALDASDLSDTAAVAKLNAELRQTLAKLTSAGSDDENDIKALLRELSTPVRHSAVPGETDPRTERCRHCGEPR